MSEAINGGYAFPGFNYVSKNVHDGMTTRDFFAAHAVAGILQMVATGQHELGIARPTGAAGIAHSAYEIADAMIAARGAA